jgi:hypothetical protein
VKGKETKHVKAFRASKSKPNESVVAHLDGWIGEAMGSGDKAQHNGSLIITDERVAFYRKGWFGELFETIPLKLITSIETKSTLGFRVLTFHTSNDSLKFKTFEDKKTFEAAYEAVEERRSARVEPTTAADPVEQLERLAKLKEQGLISPDEFDQKKAELLARI